jgi:hypothetical protein
VIAISEAALGVGLLGVLGALALTKYLNNKSKNSIKNLGKEDSIVTKLAEKIDKLANLLNTLYEKRLNKRLIEISFCKRFYLSLF